MRIKLPPVITRLMNSLSRLRDGASCLRERMHPRRLALAKRRNYDGSRPKPAEAWLRRALVLALASTCLICAGKLAAYLMDYVSSANASRELREVYHAQEEPDAETTVPATPAPSFTPLPEPSAAPQAIPANTVTAAPTAAVILPKVQYPTNPFGVISSRFAKIRRQNSDIIGWLTIPDLIDEAVVQRDNQYYLRRDYRGYHNTNGAIFLEESCSLSGRPYTLILYGHNMKTGAMFGSLRLYETAAFYHNNPFITFDTMYEDGRYVIFAVATVSIVPTDWDYLNFARLSSPLIASRQAALRQLSALSMYSGTVSVEADDQLLLLVTCKQDDSKRRVIAARRIRRDEDEAILARLVGASRKK